MWGLWWTKRHWGRFSPSTSVYPANHSIKFSIIIITRSGHSRPIGGRSAEWTQLDSTPPTIPIKKKQYRKIENVPKYVLRLTEDSRNIHCCESTRPLWFLRLSNRLSIFLPGPPVNLLCLLQFSHAVFSHATTPLNWCQFFRPAVYKRDSLFEENPGLCQLVT
jgi:hypothetical protein